MYNNIGVFYIDIKENLCNKGSYKSMIHKKFKAKDNYIKRKIAQTDVLIPIGGNVADFNGFIELNPSAAVLWDTLTIGADLPVLASALVENFGIPQETAIEDVNEFIALLLEHGMIEEM